MIRDGGLNGLGDYRLDFGAVGPPDGARFCGFHEREVLNDYRGHRSGFFGTRMWWGSIKTECSKGGMT